ncbi:MAG: hypothetical protein H7235_10015, partial [Bdellovibrionaceae bacterium]|nr:hypothetical protein [Pseudobdellovibrionaceae bacterium]
MEYNKPPEIFVLRVSELDNIGISSANIITQYQVQKRKTLNINEVVKVSSRDEGKNIKFETLDKIS